jgi:hypothetical protein
MNGTPLDDGAQPRGLETNTWIVSAPVSAAHRSPPAASSPVTGTWAPIGRLGVWAGTSQSLGHAAAVSSPCSPRVPAPPRPRQRGVPVLHVIDDLFGYY